jgi:hypothetical protein
MSWPLKFLALCTSLYCPLTANAQPRIVKFTELLTSDVLIGGPRAFVAVQALRSSSFPAGSLVSFIHAPQLGTKICLSLMSQDGRYSGAGEIDLSSTAAGSPTIALPNKSDAARYLASIPEREMAIEAVYRADCAKQDSMSVHTLAWFGKDKPGGTISFLFLALNNKPFILPDRDRPGNMVPCNLIKGAARPATALNAICELKIDKPRTVIKISIRLYDLFGGLEKELPVDVWTP